MNITNAGLKVQKTNYSGFRDQSEITSKEKKVQYGGASIILNINVEL
jgi:hypothetical protein